MSIMRRTLWACAALSAAGCESGAGTAPSEQIASAASPILHGADDLPNKFRAVVAIGGETGSLSSCTGTLITPRWVLTATHCFFFVDPADGNAISDSRNASFRIGFGYAPDLVPVIFKHTSALSGPIVTAIDHPLNPANIPDAAMDLALVRLDEPVPPEIAIPIHPPAIGACQSPHSGISVGYGTLGAPICNVNLDLRRRIANPKTWTFQPVSMTFGLYNTTTTTNGDACANYDGTIDGDSGGPTFLAPVVGDDFVLCQITHGTSPTNDGTGIVRSNAALDNADALGFITDNVVDNQGNWEGECGGPGNSTDSDGDLVPDSCDNCPTIHNPSQDDGDDDSFGDACDLCPNAADGWTNCNYETELALGYGTPKPPVITLAGSSDLAGDIAYYKDTFKPDACDPVPCPVHALTSTDGDIYPSAYPTPVPPFGSCSPGAACSWRVTNKIDILPEASAPIVKQFDPSDIVQPKGTIGLRWCDCMGDEVATIDGRRDCAVDFNCKIDPSEYLNTGGQWMTISVRAGLDWANPQDVSSEWSNLLVASPPQPEPRWWDFTKLVGHFHDGDSGSRRYVNGILWGHFIELLPEGAAGGGEPTDLDVTHRGNYYDDGGGEIALVPGTSLFVVADVYQELLCRYCPFGVTNLFERAGNPGPYRVLTDGMDLQPGVSERSKSFFADVALGNKKYLPASEPIERLAQVLAGQNSMIRGVSFSDGVVEAIVKSSAADEVPAPEEFSASGGPELRGNEGLALSGVRQELFVWGGADRSGRPSATAHLLSLAAGTWTTVPIPEAERSGAIFASTYRLEDQSVYFVDEVAGVLRLRRWEPFYRAPHGGAMRTLATFPTTWTSFATRWLTAGASGDLLFAASDNAAVPTRQTLLARFTFGGGRVTFAGSLYSSTVTSSKPRLGSRGVTRTEPDASGARLVVHALDALTMPAVSDQPTVY